MVFNIFIGGRGTGKTYSALRDVIDVCAELSEAYNKPGVKFMYFRRTEAELKNCCNDEGNPFKSLNDDFGTNIMLKSSADNALIVETTDDDNKNVIGYASSMSTFGKFRGMDFSDVWVLLFDEFICTSPINGLKKYEADLFFNSVETINRNRELKGFPPVLCILLSNSNSINNGILTTLKLGEVIHNLKVENGDTYVDPDRSLQVHLVNGESVAEAKAQTALYKLTKGTTFYEMALGNEFVTDYFGNVSKIDYRELYPVCSIDNITFYKHKVKQLMFCSYRSANCVKYVRRNIQAFKRDYGFQIGAHIERGSMFYLNYDIKLEVENLF